jgi:hypothetical protein
MFMNGYLRNINAYGRSVIELKQMRQEIRRMALQNGQVRHIHSNKDEFDIIKEHIVIYTRQDSQWRNLLEVQELIRLFDLDKYSISVVHSMPTSFYGQVELFANADLLIAPNGGWAPNVLWMSNVACLVELHLYREDSWLNMFGLGKLFEDGRFMAVTGNYSDPNAERIKRPSRKGGDDMILGSLVATDIKHALRKSSTCVRFLKDANITSNNKIQNLTASDVSSSLADDDVNKSFVMKADDAATGAGAQELRIDEHEEAVNMFYLEASPARACGLGHW